MGLTVTPSYKFKSHHQTFRIHTINFLKSNNNSKPLF